MTRTPVATTEIAERVRALDWDRLAADLDAYGYALTPPAGRTHLLRAGECDALVRLFDQDGRFRSTIDMRRLNFGSGVYRYFKRPLPPLVQALRTHLYPPLAKIANRWAALLGDTVRYPGTLGAFARFCHARGQRQPTPLIFCYEAGDFNAFHQDVYGKVGFPFQVVTVLSRDGDYRGGEFMLYKLRPRAQSLGQVVMPARGQLLIFPNRFSRSQEAMAGITAPSSATG